MENPEQELKVALEKSPKAGPLEKQEGERGKIWPKENINKNTQEGIFTIQG